MPRVRVKLVTPLKSIKSVDSSPLKTILLLKSSPFPICSHWRQCEVGYYFQWVPAEVSAFKSRLKRLLRTTQIVDLDNARFPTWLLGDAQEGFFNTISYCFEHNRPVVLPLHRQSISISFVYQCLIQFLSVGLTPNCRRKLRQTAYYTA